MIKFSALQHGDTFVMLEGSTRKTKLQDDVYFEFDWQDQIHYHKVHGDFDVVKL